MKVKVLGGANVDPGHENDAASFLLDEQWLIDTGWWCVKSLRQFGLDPLGVRGVFITHPHVDHISGLFGLLGFRHAFWDMTPEQEKFLVVCPAQSARIVETMRLLIGQMSSKKPARDINLQPMQPNGAMAIHGYEVTSLETNHKGPSLAYRFREVGSAKSAVFSGDTRFMKEMIYFAAGCDLLAHDATHVPGQPRDKCGSHCSVDDAVTIADKAGVKNLFLAHWREHQVADTQEYVKTLNKSFSIQAALPGLELEL